MGIFCLRYILPKKEEIYTEKLSLRDKARDVAITELWDRHSHLIKALYAELW